MAIITQALTGLGAICATSLALKLYRFIRLYTRSSDLERYRHKAGQKEPWALITGSSDGIGLAFAHELANEGFNIILHGRNLSKLENAKKSISQEHPSRSVRIVVADVCAPGDELLKSVRKIADELRDLHLTILVNNVGGPAPGVEPLHKPFGSDSPLIDDCISMNIRFTTQLTAALLPILSKPGLIITIGSMADIALPGVAMYAASKSFLMTWSTCLAREMKLEKIDIEVLGIIPAEVTGNSFRDKQNTLLTPTARDFVRSSLRMVGCGKNVVCGWWTHAILRTAAGFFSESMMIEEVSKPIREEVSTRLKAE